MAYVTVEPDILSLSDDLKQAIEAAEERGSMLQSDLNDLLEPLGLDAFETDFIYRQLETRSIDVYDDTREDGDRRQPPPEPEPPGPPGEPIPPPGEPPLPRPGEPSPPRPGGPLPRRMAKGCRCGTSRARRLSHVRRQAHLR